MKRIGFIIMAAGLVSVWTLLTPAESQDRSFDLMDVIGEWEGEGMFLMPVTDVEIDIEGKGKFVYLPELNVIRTEMSGSKFMLSYTDSGYLRYYPESDSVSWEIWDSWGKHSLYWGEIKGDQLVAQREHPKRYYKVTVEFPHPDTLDFRLTSREKESGDTEEKARFILWRTK